MREIKFRGKDLLTGEWRYSRKDLLAKMFSTTLVDCTGDYHGSDVPDVDPMTVGQYTGLKDKDGWEIYEGDVVRQYYRDNDGGIGLVVFAEDSAKFGIRFFDESGEAKCLFSIPGYMDLMYDESCRTVEVIGNIHDNPELLTK